MENHAVQNAAVELTATEHSAAGLAAMANARQGSVHSPANMLMLSTSISQKARMPRSLCTASISHL